jgi:imidazolonepropionase-like amidohydrolase/ABC-type multidrug transport system permease subunit
MSGGLWLIRLVLMSMLRSRVSLFFTLAFPFFLVLAFGYIFGRDRPEVLRFTAAQLFVTVVVANALFGLGNLLLELRRKGVLRRLYVTSLRPWAVLSAVLAAWLVLSTLTFGVMLGALEIVFHGGLVGRAPALWSLMLLCTGAMAGIAFLLASIVDRPEGLAMGANALFFPMLFLSGLSIPSFLLPEWIQRIGRVLPTHAMLELFRGVTENRPLGGLRIVYGITILLMGIAGFLGALAVYRWNPHQPLSRRQRVQLVAALALLIPLPWAGSSLGQSVGYVRRWLAPRYVLAVGHVMDGERVLPGSPVYIGVLEGRIAFVGTSVPEDWRGAPVRNFADLWATPGLIDMHVHLESPVVPVFDPTMDPDDRIRHDLVAGYTGSGVTALRSFGDVPAPLHEVRRLASAGLRPYPRLFLSGPIFTAPGGHPLELPAFRWMSPQQVARRVIQVTDPASAREAIRRLLPSRPDWIKIVYDSGHVDYRTFPRISPDTLKALIEEAHRAGLKVAVHISKVEELRDAVTLGADMIEHTPVDAVIDDDLLAEMRRRGTVVDPTLCVIENVMGRPSRRQTEREDAFILARLMKPLREALEQQQPFDPLDFVPERYRALAEKSMDAYAAQRTAIAQTNVRRMATAGIPLVAGSDAGNPGVYHGPGLICELEALARAGLSPLEALRAATALAGTVLGEPIGRIHPGFHADIALYAGDPTTDWTALRRIRWVVLRGRIYSVADLLQ